MPDYPEIFVLRHGQTEWNREGRHQGRLDSPLTERGRAQARQQGEILTVALAGRDDFAAFTSPQGRAFDTAQLALASMAVTATVDPQLCEISFGDWEGLKTEDIAARWPEHCKSAAQDPFAWHFLAVRGESFAQICDRAGAFLTALDRPSIIVTHGITSRILRGLWLGGDFGAMAALPGGQGCVFHLKCGQQVKLESAQPV